VKPTLLGNDLTEWLVRFYRGDVPMILASAGTSDISPDLVRSRSKSHVKCWLPRARVRAIR